MKVTKENLTEIKAYLEKQIINRLIQHFSGWENQINPSNLVYKEDRINYQKEFPFNVFENRFIKVELEKDFIRLKSSEFEVDPITNSEDYKNVLIKIGHEIEVIENVMVLIDTQNPFSEKLKTGNSFDVFVFNSKLEKL